MMSSPEQSLGASRRHMVRRRHGVLGLLFLLSAITFLDRVALSVAGPRMQSELGIGPSQWGWVVGVFAFSYGLFEIPAGILGDRIGARKVLTRIVVWWSAFTSLTGAATSFVWLLVCRFFFGMGEAGAYPNISLSISRWFPRNEHAFAYGAIWMASRLGAAATPILMLPIMAYFGWRATFHILGLIGVLWALVYWITYRDDPKEKAGISNEELLEISSNTSEQRHEFQWSRILRSRNLLLLVFMYHCVAYGNYFYLSWLHTYLSRGLHFGENEVSVLSTLPFLLGAVANLAGGRAADYMVAQRGPRLARRLIGGVCMTIAAIMLLTAAFVPHRTVVVACFALAAAASDFMLPTCWATCLDIGSERAGTVTSIMNTAGQVGSFVSAVFFGYAVEALHSYSLPLVGLAAMTLLGAVCWLKIDATEKLVGHDAPGNENGSAH